MSAGLLHVLGLSDLVARDLDQYVAIAATLASDVSRLDKLHRTLRPRMATSPLCDGVRAARDLEEAYRAMWREWVSRH